MSLITLVLVGIAAVSAQSASWQSYVDEQLVGAGLKSGVIFGHDGAVWAKNNVDPTTEETKRIADQYKDPSSVFATGIKLGGVKYMGIKGDERSLYGKKGAGGIVVVKTGQAIIAGEYDQNVQPGNAALTVEKLADYLIENGY